MPSLRPLRPRGLLSLFSLIFSVLAALCLTGCATVSPYERGDLSRPSMDSSREAGEAGFHAHVNDSREGATGGMTSTGGGCGCN